jgi:hypothetical protein
MRSNISCFLGLILASPFVAYAMPQDTSKGQTAAAQRVAPQPAKDGRQVYKSTLKTGGVTKPGAATPESTVTLKPGEVPSIRFDTQTYDFGHIRAASDVSHDYWFANTGNGPLEILAVRPGCGCTSSGQYDRVVQPGQAGKIPIKVNTHGSGPLSKTISIQTNAPGAEANVTLTIKGELWQIVDATPPNVMYGSIRGSGITPDQLIRKVAIKNNDPQPIKLETPTSTNPVFTTELKELEPGKAFELVITAKQPLPLGNTSGSVQMNTGIKEMPVLNIPVSIYVTADVEATPAQLVLPLSIPKAMQRMVYVRNYIDAKPMKVTEASINSPDIKTEITEAQPGVAWRININVPKDFHLASGGGKLTIKTDSPSMPELTVPILQAGTASIPTVQAGTSMAAPTTVAGPVISQPNAAQGTGNTKFKSSTSGTLPNKSSKSR